MPSTDHAPPCATPHRPVRGRVAPALWRCLATLAGVGVGLVGAILVTGGTGHAGAAPGQVDPAGGQIDPVPGHVVPAPATTPADTTRFVVMVDPGHGGSDPGARGPNGLLEKHLTLDIARRLRLFLSEIDGFDVVLTRDEDRGLSRASRVHRVRASEADLFVSLHFNHLPQNDVTLVESFYADAGNIAESRRLRRLAAADGPLLKTAEAAYDLGYVKGSRRFASLAQRRVFDEVERRNPAALDAGVKTDTLFVLTRSETSGALVELTCLSDLDEAERLNDHLYRDNLAAGLADAIRDYRASLDTRPIDGEGA